MLSLPKMHPKCEGCGLEIEGGKDGCQRLIEEIWAREHADFRYGRFHRLVVDVYCLQHPWYCHSPKSYLAHLAGLCCNREYEGRQAVYDAIRRSLDDPRRVPEKPEIPTFRGHITVAPAHASGPAEYAQHVDEWSLDVWKAYTPLHSFTRAWLQKALASSHERTRHKPRR
jgi:hypothetical protein